MPSRSHASDVSALDNRKGKTAMAFTSGTGPRSPRGHKTAASRSAPTTVTPASTLRAVFALGSARNAAVGTVPEPGVVRASNRLSSSAAVCQRSAGFFSRHRMTSSANAGGTVPRWLVTGSGVSLTWAASIACGVVAVNKVRPVSISYAIAPTA